MRPRVTAEDLAAELAWCLSRFMDATADETVMQRSRDCLSLWASINSSEGPVIDLSLVGA